MGTASEDSMVTRTRRVLSQALGRYISKDVIRFRYLSRCVNSEVYSKDYESLIVLGYTVCCHYLYMLSVDT